MASRSNVSPATLPVRATDAGIEVEYLDGRTVTYTAPPEPVEGTITVPERSHVHVLVVDEAAEQGQMVYVNDLDTADEILERSGVGRVLVDEGENVTVAQGVDLSRAREQVRIAVEYHPPDRVVFVFVENQLDERAYRIDPAREE